MINDDRRKIAARLYEKHAKLGAVLVHPDGSDVRGTRFCEYEQRKANQQSGVGDE